MVGEKPRQARIANRQLMLEVAPKPVRSSLPAKGSQTTVSASTLSHRAPRPSQSCLGDVAADYIIGFALFLVFAR